MSMATSSGSLVMYNEELSPIKSLDSLITWSDGIMWQIEKISTTTMSLANRHVREVT